MFKNRIKKFIVALLSVFLIIPAFSINKVSANDVTTVFVGVDYEYSIDVDWYKQHSASDVKISYYNGFEKQGTLTDVFVDNDDVSESDDVFVRYSTNSTKTTITIEFHNVGEYEIVLQPKTLDPNDPADAQFKKFKVVDDPNDAGIKLSYKTGADLTSAIADYKEEVLKIVEDEQGVDKLVAGKDSFKLPSVLPLIDCSFAYSTVKKTVYYNIPGDASYKNTSSTAGTPSFSLTKFGTYRFYVLLESDNLLNNSTGKKVVETKGLKEYADGFYQVKDNGTNVYYNTTDKLFYEDLEFETKINSSNADSNDDGVLENDSDKTLVVPIFEFSLEKTAPTIEIVSKVLEDGYVGAKYSSVGKISIYGNAEEIKYELQYRQNKNQLNWETLDGEDESFDQVNLTFIPQKLGEYRILVTATTSGYDTVSATTAVIEVNEEYVEYEYKVSFSDWLSVNVLPFVLLCISAVCLIAIILLIVVKPKDNSKIQAKEEDR